MADPNVIACPVDTWVLVASGVTEGVVTVKKIGPKYIHTYRETGNPAPVNNDDAIPFQGIQSPISSLVAIDVYVKAKTEDGSIVIAI